MAIFVMEFKLETHFTLTVKLSWCYKHLSIDTKRPIVRENQIKTELGCHGSSQMMLLDNNAVSARKVGFFSFC